MSSRAYSVQELASRFGLEAGGEAAAGMLQGVGTLESAGATQVTFLANPLYRKHLPRTRAGLVILRADDAGQCPVPFLIARDPYASFARIAALFDCGSAGPAAGIHCSAVVDASAQVASTASVGPLACIGARSVIGEGAVIGAGCVIGEDCRIGAGSQLMARVTLVLRVRLGERVRIHSGAVIGAEGFGLAMDAGAWLKVPQLGGVSIGDDCEIGANTCIDRGAIDDTVLEADVRLDNQVQIGHNVRIGAHTAMAGCVAIAGSTRIGSYCLIGGGAGMVGHIEVCDRVLVTAMTLVTHSITEPGQYSSGTPMQAAREWRRNAARFKHLDQLARKLAALPQAEE